MMDSTARNSMFRWVCLGFAVVGAGFLMNSIRGARDDLHSITESLNEKLPAILENVKKSSEQLAVLSEDFKQLRDLAGVANETRDRSLVLYADSILDFIEEAGGEIGVERIIGKKLKDVDSSENWVVSARKEALWLSFRARGRAELLEKICRNKFRSDWMIQFPAQKPQKLIDWLQENHPPTTELFRPSQDNPISKKK